MTPKNMSDSEILRDAHDRIINIESSLFYLQWAGGLVATGLAAAIGYAYYRIDAIQGMIYAAQH